MCLRGPVRGHRRGPTHSGSGQSSRVSRNICHTSSRCSADGLGRPCRRCPRAAARRCRRCPPGSCSRVRGRTSPALRMTIGTTGTPPWMAMWNGPFLKGSSSEERVPSGETAMDTPFCRLSTTGWRAARACVGSARSMKAMPARAPRRSEHGVGLQRLLGHCREVATQDSGHDHDVQLALVVEQEDGRPVGPDVLLPLDVEVHPGGGQPQVGCQTDHHVGAVTLVAVGDGHGCSGDEARAETADGGGGPSGLGETVEGAHGLTFSGGPHPRPEWWTG